MTEALEARRRRRWRAGALAILLAANPGYLARVGGGSRLADARDVLTAFPAGAGREQKISLGLSGAAGLAACADVNVGWPNPAHAHVGLLMTAGERDRHGLGRRMHDAVVATLEVYPQVRTLRLAIVGTNAHVAEPFWSALGYCPNGESKPYASGGAESVARVWERALSQ
ncbi:N-acetyltransferase [Demequina capsici]|uniref:N-acetyltransferase n=1 Tax=Demequina capsici TaxID=3075620 RepID=A0AA96FAD7_9MICO|nr:N-acetyltransferase [Demequina sp. OYTSA14]WNM25091.1 N-acetyltransferase [Demequina sp. OYTSA14]